MKSARAEAPPTRRIALFAEDARTFPEDVAPLVTRLVSAGHRVRCFAPDWPDYVARLATALGAETDTFPIRPAATWRLMPQRALRNEIAVLLESWAPSVVAAIGPSSAAVVLPAVADEKVRRVAVLDRWEFAGAAVAPLVDGSRLIDDRILSGLAQSADSIVCHTPDSARAIQLAFAQKVRARDTPTVTALPGFGVATSRIATREPPPAADGVVFLLTAPLDRWKGIEDYIEAARLLARSGARARFRLQAAPGRGEDPLDLDQLAGLDAVEVVGRETSLEDAVAAAHVLVVASHHEGTPRELLTALAIGRPVIATDLPGCRAAIDEIVNGCLVPSGHPGALASACESLARRPDLLPAMGRASRLKAERRFEQDAVTRQYFEVLGLAG